MIAYQLLLGLQFHARSKHGINIVLGNKEQELEEVQSQPEITNYFETVKQDSMNALISRLCAKDGLSFSVIAKSEDLKLMINKLGLGRAPRSHATVQTCVISYAVFGSNVGRAGEN